MSLTIGKEYLVIRHPYMFQLLQSSDELIRDQVDLIPSARLQRVCGQCSLDEVSLQFMLMRKLVGWESD